jgi:hypothetical protein
MNPGRLFFGSFLLAKQKKGTSRRATPGSLNQSLLRIDAYKIHSIGTIKPLTCYMLALAVFAS